MVRPKVSQRIESRNAVTQLTIGVDQVGYIWRQSRLRSCSRRACSGQLAVARDLEAGKECPPLARQRLAVALILRLQSLQVLGVGAAKKIERAHRVVTLARGTLIGTNSR